MTKVDGWDWEGYPKGLEDWMRKQKQSVTIFCIADGEIIWTMGDGPYLFYSAFKDYVVKDELEIPFIDMEKICADYCEDPPDDDPEYRNGAIDVSEYDDDENSV